MTDRVKQAWLSCAALCNVCAFNAFDLASQSLAIDFFSIGPATSLEGLSVIPLILQV